MLMESGKYDVLNDYHNGKSVRQIAKDRKCGRNTVRKYIREWEEETAAQIESMTELEISQSMMGGPVYDSSNRARTVVTPEVEEIIIGCLSENDRKRRNGRSKEQQNAVNIHEAILQAGYTVSYQSVVKAVRRLSEVRREAYIKQVYSPGEVCEFDWGEVWLTIGGKNAKYMLGVFTLAASNIRFALLYRRQHTASFVDSHAHAFRYFGGIPLQMVYDNMRVAVAEFAGKNSIGGEYEDKPDKVATIALKQMAAYYGFGYRFCNIRRGNEKGHVERSVDVVRNRAFSGRDIFETEEEANAELQAAVDKLNSDKLAKDVIDANSAYTLEDERTAMLPEKPGHFWSETHSRKADKFSTISINANRYSVPDHLVGKRVDVTEFADRISVFYGGREVAAHLLVSGKGAYVLNIHHYLETLKRKPGALRGSLCLQQAEDNLRGLYEDYFTDAAKEFVLVLIEMPEYSMLDLRTSCELLRENNAKITADGIRMLLTDVPYIDQPSDADAIERACMAQLQLQSKVLATGSKLAAERGLTA